MHEKIQKVKNVTHNLPEKFHFFDKELTILDVRLTSLCVTNVF